MTSSVGNCEDNLGKVPGDPLHDVFVGDAPTPQDPTHVATSTSDSMQYAVAQRLLGNDIGDSKYFHDQGLIDPATVR